MLFILAPGVINPRKSLQRPEPAPGPRASLMVRRLCPSPGEENSRAGARGMQRVSHCAVVKFPHLPPCVIKGGNSTSPPLALPRCASQRPSPLLSLQRLLSQCLGAMAGAWEKRRRGITSISRQAQEAPKLMCWLPPSCRRTTGGGGLGSSSIAAGCQGCFKPSHQHPQAAAAAACLNPVTGRNKHSYLSTRGYF